MAIEHRGPQLTLRFNSYKPAACAESAVKAVKAPRTPPVAVSN